MLIQLFYVSEIVEPMTETIVQSILSSAQIRNRRLDLTGMLAQSDGHFAQILEGRAEAVDDVIKRVSADSRHRDLRIVLREPITRRAFSKWAMGLVRRDDMADEMAAIHAHGCGAPEAARKMIHRLLAEESWPR